jgi:sterol desaturase/sphingolipid hydroxylase (fatty acid hydroxylase superfamily)
MPKVEINTSEEPIRLFKSDFLEFFTHITPLAIIIIWSPVAIFFLVSAIINRPQAVSIFYIPLGFMIGVFIWTLAEYLLHRFVFHFHAKSARGQRITFLFHGVHHAQPQCKTRLVMPPVVSIPGFFLFYGSYFLILSVVLKVPYWIAPLMFGSLIGYLFYDLGHYATHHSAMRSGYGKIIKRNHMLHHYRTPNKRFGVSSTIWDYVFQTRGD